ncbi:MAG: PD-(D/E)XK nuclease family protein, partial [Acidobacteriaceae bacterium]|nr:PD-(D/E)XK nuclease family protein [Acidobacteriaceae bacterium]
YSQLEKGRNSWERPAIYTIEAWLASCWQEARYGSAGVPALLSPLQEILLWQKIIEEQTPSLFDVTGTARLARRTATLVREWQIPVDAYLWSENHDGEQFQRWYQRFRTICRQEGWIARSDLWELVGQWMSEGLYEPGPVIFLGIDEPSPAHEAIRRRLRPSAVFGTTDSAQGRLQVALKSCTDFKGEIELAARWARTRFEQGPSASTGIFVPDLAGQRELVERTFRQVFYPGSALRPVLGTQGPSDAESVFHINAAAPLQEHPLVSSALLLLELARPRIDHADATAILRCPFIKGAEGERSARALADLRLRELRELDVSLRDIERASRDCQILNALWLGVRKVLDRRKRRQELSAWSEFIGDLLEVTGWPGDAELAAEEQEAVDGWKNALSALASLGVISPAASYDEALSHLRRLLSGGGTERGDWFSPIQILDATDARGLVFDAAFVTGLSDESWPPATTLPPLIPIKLQREYKMPAASAQSLKSERERMTRAVLASGSIVYGSYSGRVSPYVERLAERGYSDVDVWGGKLPIESFAPARTEEVQDTYAPAFDVSKKTRGGTTIIKLQSLCPFRAFAEIRLRAQSPDDACFGFDARDRGGFMHRALQYVWEEVKTQQKLIALPDGEVRDIVHNAVLRAVTDNQESRFYKQMTHVERERLEDLVFDWLVTIERHRLKPFTVERIEDDFYYDLAGLPVRLRVDRIDRLKNGQLVLIDYKSGKQSRGKLECPRPSEPQLLVYAAAKGSEVDGVLFGELRPRELRLVGFSRERHFKGQSITVKNDDWDAFADDSRAEVERLATQFLEGYAAVDPKSGACEYCSLRALCRVNERFMQAEDAD